MNGRRLEREREGAGADLGGGHKGHVPPPLIDEDRRFFFSQFHLSAQTLYTLGEICPQMLSDCILALLIFKIF